jgi:aspartyl-tRNA(Asn)/glutamyl-tRNA(Gln) amidotransferase subunit B
MPELPEARRARFMEEYELSYADASQLTGERALADYFERAARAANNPRGASNWIRSELLRELETAGRGAEDSPVAPEELGALVRLVDEGRISGKQAKDVLVEMFRTGKAAAAVVEEQGLAQVSDVTEIERIVAEVVAANPKLLKKLKG